MIEKMYKESPEGQIHIQKLLSANCFGDYLTRKGLDVKTRELLTFSMLLSFGGCEPQLKGHIQGNMNVGNDKEFTTEGGYGIIAIYWLPKSFECHQMPERNNPRKKMNTCPNRLLCGL